MAMNAGIGFYRILFVVGAGYTGTLLLKNGKLSDVLAELQNLVKGLENSGESDEGHPDAITAQIHRLTIEIHRLASSKPVTVLTGNSGSSNLTPLVMPAAAMGALGYGYMWWKGLSFSDLMYVTKHSMANAVANLTKHLEGVSEALAAAKRHLTQRIENLDEKLDEQVDISKSIRGEVNDGRVDIAQISIDLDELQRMLSSCDIANKRVIYLCSIVSGKKAKTPEMLQDQSRVGGRSLPSPMGLQEIVDALPSENKLLMDGNVQDGADKLKDLSRNLMRTVSNKC